MADSRSIHISTNDPILFLVMAGQYSVEYIYHIFFIHSSVNWHLGCFHILAVVNSAAANTEVHVPGMERGLNHSQGPSVRTLWQHQGYSSPWVVILLGKILVRSWRHFPLIPLQSLAEKFILLGGYWLSQASLTVGMRTRRGGNRGSCRELEIFSEGFFQRRGLPSGKPLQIHLFSAWCWEVGQTEIRIQGGNRDY